MIKKSTKILFIVTQSQWGGAQRHVYDLAVNLKNEFDITVVFGEKKELFDRLGKEKIKTIPLPYLKRNISFINDLLAFSELIKVIKREKPEIIHLNSSKAGILGSLAAKLGGVKRVVYTAHGWVFNEPLSCWLKFFYFWLEKISASWKDKIVCVSEFDRQIAIEKNLCRPVKLITIHNGIDPKINFLPKDEAINYLKSKICHLSSNTKIAGCIANFYKTKGLKYLIEAAKTINNPELAFIVIGEGEERKNLENLIKKCGLENNFFLLGNTANAAQYLKAFDLFVLPSLKEGFPYTILEAMAAQIPIITTKVGGIPEIIENNRTGILVDSKNPQQLAEKIAWLLDNPQIAADYGLKAREKLEKDFELKLMLKKTKEIYNPL